MIREIPMDNRNKTDSHVTHSNRPFAAERSRGTNRQTGEQMPHWAMLNKENLNLVALFNMSQRSLLSSLAILYHVIAQLQRAHSLEKLYG